MSCFFKKYFVAMMFVIGLSGCHKSNFFEDVDDPGLSRFTSRHYNVTSAYINNEPWISGSLSEYTQPSIFLDTTTIPEATLYITWEGDDYRYNWPYITIGISVKKDFSLNDFFIWNGKIFPADSTTATIVLHKWQQLGWSNSISGKVKIYFVKIEPQPMKQNDFNFCGLFEGNIGDSVIISKGRFDYSVSSTSHNLK